jgi:hypothetical protein
MQRRVGFQRCGQELSARVHNVWNLINPGAFWENLNFGSRYPRWKSIHKELWKNRKMRFAWKKIEESKSNKISTSSNCTYCSSLGSWKKNQKLLKLFLRPMHLCIRGWLCVEFQTILETDLKRLRFPGREQDCGSGSTKAIQKEFSICFQA